MKVFVGILCCLALAAAIPVDNGVEGEPEIECGATSITVNFNTRNTFEGHVYVKGRYNETGCRSDEGGRKVAGIALPFSSCGVQRTRSLNPRGVFVSVNVIITFHPQFVTKVDRSYTVQCFYMEADKTVTQELEVSELTSLFQTQVVPMPVCRYDILDGSAQGQPIRFAIVGQQVYHKWTCDTETVDTFCMTVHSCNVDDGQGNRVDLLNDQGCAQDKFLLNNLEYLTDLMAGREAHVFKYADKAALFFQCQISITIKEPGQQCPRPQCADPQRGKRHALATEEAGTWDVVAQPITALDIDEDVALPQSLRDYRQLSVSTRIPAGAQGTSAGGEGICLSTSGFAVVISLVVALVVAAVAVSTVLCLKQSSKN